MFVLSFDTEHAECIPAKVGRQTRKTRPRPRPLKFFLETLCSRSYSIFVRFASGDLGHGLIADYMCSLERFRYLGIPTVAKEYFHMSLQAMAENWRRLVLTTQSFPFCLFGLLDCGSDHEFLTMYARLKSAQQKCAQCCDIEFSTILLNFIDDAGDPIARGQQVTAIRRLLADTTTFAPLSSDIVECLHGYSQHLLHRWQGCKPSDPVAQERVLWVLITRAWAKLREWIWDRYGDRSSGHRMHKFGKSSRNQYSSAQGSKTCKPQPDKTMTFEKLDRLIAFQQESSLTTSRKLCGALVVLALFVGKYSTVSKQIVHEDGHISCYVIGIGIIGHRHI